VQVNASECLPVFRSSFFFKVSTLCSESQPNEKIWQGWPCFFDLLRPTAWRKRARRLLLETWSNSIQKYLNVEQYKQFPYLNEPGYVVICLLFFSDPYFPFFQPRKQWISISGKRTPSSPIIIFLLINCGFLKITPQIDYFRHSIVPSRLQYDNWLTRRQLSSYFLHTLLKRILKHPCLTCV